MALQICFVWWEAVPPHSSGNWLLPILQCVLCTNRINTNVTPNSERSVASCTCCSLFFYCKMGRKQTMIFIHILIYYKVLKSQLTLQKPIICSNSISIYNFYLKITYFYNFHLFFCTSILFIWEAQPTLQNDTLYTNEQPKIIDCIVNCCTKCFTT